MNNESLPAPLILASGSKYRKLLLQRLGLSFECRTPGVDESALEAESPAEQVARLAAAKASAVGMEAPGAVVIGSDQIAVSAGQVVGKPGGYQNAFEQLQSFSGKAVEFLTAVSVQSRAGGIDEHHTDRTLVIFRNLESTEIERYLQQEQPYDCAGAFKAEALGISLFERIESVDPTALMGLPLIRTAAMLRRAGFALP